MTGVTFGRDARALFALDPGITFLNHGSFGVTPNDVLEAQDRFRAEMESDPDGFFRYRLRPLLRETAAKLGEFLGVPGDSLVFCDNATTGVNTVLRSLDFSPGDEILYTDHTYNAVHLAIEAVCRKSRAKPVRVPLGLDLADDEATIARLMAAVTPRTKLAVMDHITSPTAIVLPVVEMTRALKERGVRVLVDAAHAPGQIEFDIAKIGADWVTGNCHKWLFAPKGSAFLYASQEMAAQTQPIVVSHFAADGFPRGFDYLGTNDPTAYLSIPVACEFYRRFGGEAVRAHNHALVKQGAGILSRLGVRRILSPRACAMISLALPQTRAATPDDAHEIMLGMKDRHRINAACHAFAGALLLRLSAQIYNERADYELLASALAKDGWPARS